jgi:hypothetical protein
MKVDLSKRLRSIVRELAAKAHEREMRKLLAPVANSFAAWRSGTKGTWALLEDIDRFNLPRRRLTQRYETTSIAPMMVAYALVAGFLREDEVPAEVLDALSKPIAFYRQGLADGTVRMEEED